MERNASIINKIFIFLGHLVNGNSCMYFELDRRLDRALLQRAFEALVARHPLLNRRLSPTWSGYRWLNRPLTKVAVEFQETSLARKDEVEALLRQNAWRNNLQLFGERHLKAYCLDTPDASYVQLVQNHVLADARSADLLMSELATIYRCLSRNEPLGDTLPEIRYSSNSLVLFAGHLPTRRKVWLAAIALTNIVTDALRGRHGIAVARTAPTGETHVLTQEVDSRLVDQMKPLLKQNGYTMHPILVLSVLRAIEQFNARRGKNSKVLRVSDMFSLLPFSNQDLTKVYDCFVLPFTTYYRMQDDDLAMMTAIRDGIRRQKEGAILRELFRQAIYTAAGTFAPKRLATRLVTQLVVKSDIVISNPGTVKFDIPDFGDARIVSYTNFSQLFPPAKVFFLFSSFRNTLRLSILYDSNAFSRAEIEEEIYSDFLLSLQRITGQMDHITTEAGHALAPATG